MNDLTKHARERMLRRLPPIVVRHVVEYGRVVFVRGATIYAVGRKEVARFRREGVDLATGEGVQVVCSNDGAVMTVHRNHDFRGLRPRRRRRKRRTW